MNLEVFADDESAAQAAAKFIAAAAQAGVAARGQFVMAVSGGRTPWIMLRALAEEKLPWEHIHVVQVDERVAPAGNQDRISRIFGKVCSITPPFDPGISIPCRWIYLTWKLRPGSMP